MKYKHAGETENPQEITTMPQHMIKITSNDTKDIRKSTWRRTATNMCGCVFVFVF